MAFTNEDYEVISLLTKKTPVLKENYEVGKIYASYAGSLYYICDETNAAYDLDDYEDERKNIPAGSYLYGSDVVGIENDVHIPLFTDASLLLVKYLGNGVFEDIQSKAKIAPVSVLGEHIEPMNKEEADKFNDILKEYQMFYDHKFTQSRSNLPAEEIIEDAFLVFDIEKDKEFASEVKKLYDNLVLSNESLCSERKDIILRMQKQGIHIPELTKELRKATSEEQIDAKIEDLARDTGFNIK